MGPITCSDRRKSGTIRFCRLVVRLTGNLVVAREIPWWPGESRRGTGNPVVAREISSWHGKSRRGTGNPVVAWEIPWWHGKLRDCPGNPVVRLTVTFFCAPSFSVFMGLLSFCASFVLRSGWDWTGCQTRWDDRKSRPQELGLAVVFAIIVFADLFFSSSLFFFRHVRAEHYFTLSTLNCSI